MYTDLPRAQIQTSKAIVGLRTLITTGELQPGERISELMLVARLGVSRTPARAALQTLRDEGLVEILPSGRFVASEFTEADVFDAIEIRGTLEGLAARFGAERGAPVHVLAHMRECVSSLDFTVSALPSLEAMNDFVTLNNRFHTLLLECGQSAMIERSLQRISALPFAVPHVFVQAPSEKLPEICRNLVFSHEQHHQMLEAIENREGARAQALTLEHARSAWKYLKLVFDIREERGHVSALSLVRKRA